LFSTGNISHCCLVHHAVVMLVIVSGKDIDSIRVVVCGCGAAGFTCAKYFVSLGVKKDNMIAVDVQVGRSAAFITASTANPLPACTGSQQDFWGSCPCPAWHASCQPSFPGSYTQGSGTSPSKGLGTLCDQSLIRCG
jgi:hypothetical protein